MSARKNRPHAQRNLVTTQTVNAMALANSTNTEAKDTKYNKGVSADMQHPSSKMLVVPTLRGNDRRAKLKAVDSSYRNDKEAY
jgi:hypothetical protein